MNFRFSSILIVCIVLTSCGADEVEYLSCQEYLALNEYQRTDFVENYVQHEEEEEEDKWAHERVQFPRDFTERLKTTLDQCEKYEENSLGVVDLAIPVRFGRDPLLKGERDSWKSEAPSISASSTCEAFNAASSSEQAWLIDDLITGTGMKLNRDFSDNRDSIKRCASDALQKPCASGMTVRDAMAACFVSY